MPAGDAMAARYGQGAGQANALVRSGAESGPPSWEARVRATGEPSRRVIGGGEPVQSSQQTRVASADQLALRHTKGRCHRDEGYHPDEVDR